MRWSLCVEGIRSCAVSLVTRRFEVTRFCVFRTAVLMGHLLCAPCSVPSMKGEVGWSQGSYAGTSDQPLSQDHQMLEDKGSMVILRYEICSRSSLSFYN